ncbi:LysR family transcriptional regulator [Sphingobium sp. S6]|uniref:LysR family transcriptional regulator n=1 Tax=Sphingobium sp. S6 TaxID=2758386 RepID=UPI00191B013A|nr:LysR family transcriptional regulator [Sphingobium sp. S6]CAD7337912.1 HTH-type transcriptional regulator BenM [Sphingobium sp. S8]CAD7339050.1 HTH-type transcriptional regulator BenM [Sphingobium sp. S6]
MDLRRLRYFVAVAELGSFRMAAERLHVSQSAVSRRVQELEQEVGHALLDRSGPRPRLLLAGEVLMGHALAIFRAVDDASQHLARFSSGQIGLLRLGMTPLTGQIDYVVDAIGRFQRERPDVRLQLQLLESSDLLREAVRKGALEAAIIYRDGVALSGMCVLRSYGALLAVGASHRLASRSEVSLADLKDENIISFSRTLDPATYDQQIAAFHRHGVTPNLVHELASEDVRLSLVAAGLGVSIVGGAVVDRPTRSDVVFIGVNGLDLRRKLALLSQPSMPLPAVEAFAKIISACASNAQPERRRVREA